MSKLLNYLFLLCLSVAGSVLVMVYGWGIHPRSWWWIIGYGVFANTAIKAVFDAVEKSGKS